jgi:hypothetical protein
MYCGTLVTVSKLLKFVYDIEAFRALRRPVGKSVRVPIDPSPPTANTRGATPRKDKGKAQVANKSKPKAMDKVKGKLIEPEKPKNLGSFPLQTDRAFKIFEKDPVPPASPVTQSVKRSPIEKKKLAEAPLELLEFSS